MEGRATRPLRVDRDPSGDARSKGNYSYERPRGVAKESPSPAPWNGAQRHAAGGRRGHLRRHQNRELEAHVAREIATTSAKGSNAHAARLTGSTRPQTSSTPAPDHGP
jgi:hypothetical protein